MRQWSPVCVASLTLQPIAGALSHQVLEDAKAYMQEQLLRKAHQKEVDIAMEEEKER